MHRNIKKSHIYSKTWLIVTLYSVITKIISVREILSQKYYSVLLSLIQHIIIITEYVIITDQDHS